MTALAGYWAFRHRGDPLAYCDEMLTAQRLYGLAPPRIWHQEELALGHRLFATLPEDWHDTGPVVGGGGRWVLVADIRLDNRKELCATLGVESAELLSDAAVAMRCIERWQADAIERLIGDFALALWDRSERRLLLARDYAGQRPLHYHRGAAFFAFASMPKGLHALAGIPMGVDSEAAAKFVAMLPSPHGQTLFQGICRVAPGEQCIIDGEGLAARPHWSFSPNPLRLARSEDYAEAVRESLDRAVEARLRGAEGGVATHLSGGLDSGAVTATAARQMAPVGQVAAFTSVPGEGSGEPLNPGRFIDEGAHAAAVAALYPNLVHILVRTAGRSPIAALDRNFRLYDQPVVNLCNWVWGEAIAEETQARGLKVLLTGAMGNFSFSHTGLELLPQLLQRGRLWRLVHELHALRRNGVRRRLLGAKTVGPFLPWSVWRWINRLDHRITSFSDFTLIRPDLAPGLKKQAESLALDSRPLLDPSVARLTAIRRADPGVYNKGALAEWQIDTRDPTADRRLLELCLNIPPEQFLSEGKFRALARAAFSDRLPAVVLTEQRKGYQAADWHLGLSASLVELREEVEHIAECPAAVDVLDVRKMRSLVDQLPAQQLSRPEAVAPYRLALLRGVSAGHFIRRASDC